MPMELPAKNAQHNLWSLPMKIGWRKVLLIKLQNCQRNVNFPIWLSALSSPGTTKEFKNTLISVWKYLEPNFSSEANLLPINTTSLKDMVLMNLQPFRSVSNNSSKTSNYVELNFLVLSKLLSPTQTKMLTLLLNAAIILATISQLELSPMMSDSSTESLDKPPMELPTREWEEEPPVLLKITGSDLVVTQEAQESVQKKPFWQSGPPTEK